MQGSIWVRGIVSKRLEKGRYSIQKYLDKMSELDV